MRPSRRLSARLAALDRSWLSVPAGVLAAAGVLRYAPLSGEAATMVAITVFCVSLWIGTPVPHWFTALACVGLVGVAFSTDLALVGFRSAATWLVVLGVLVGEAVRASGLADLVERGVLRRVPARAAGDARAAYRYLLVALSAFGLGFAVLVPSSLVRVLVLGPILISVGDLFAERRPAVGLFLGPLFATYYGASGILTGSLANIIIAGLVEADAGLAIGWTEWLLWMGPVMGVGRTAAVVAIAYALYRPRDPDSFEPAVERESGTAVDERGERATADERGERATADEWGERTTAVERDRGTAVDEWDERATADERRMLAFLLVGVAVWATDAVHGLHPLYGALLVVLLAFAPRVGVVGPDAVSEADFSIVFFLGAIFAVAEGLRRTAVAERAAGAALSTLPGDAPLAAVLAVVALVAVGLAFLMEGLAVASVLTPILTSFAASAGVPLLPVAMVEAAVLNTFFFPYQSAVLVAILGLGVVDARELVRMASLASLATLLVLLPIQIAVFALLF